MEQVTPQEAYYLAGLVARDINQDVQQAKPLPEIQVKQKTLSKLRKLAGEEDRRIEEDAMRAFNEFKRQARMDAYHRGEREQ